MVLFLIKSTSADVFDDQHLAEKSTNFLKSNPLGENDNLFVKYESVWRAFVEHVIVETNEDERDVKELIDKMPQLRYFIPKCSTDDVPLI